MNNKKVQVIAMNAMIAAVYAVLTILISPIAYGAVQMRLYDICFGTAATLIACLGMYYFKNVFVGAFIGGAVNGLIVGLELYLALELPFMINAFYVFVGEFVVLVIGAILFKCLEKNKTLMNNYILE